MGTQWIPAWNDGGGYLTHKNSDETVYSYGSAYKIYAGWRCQKAGTYYGQSSDRYECYDYESYIRFPITDLSQVSPENYSAYLWVYCSDSSYQYVTTQPTNVQIDVYTKTSQFASGFPTYNLSVADYEAGGWVKAVDGWKSVGSVNSAGLDDSWNCGATVIDLSSEIRAAVTRGDEWFAVKLVPSALTPTGWSYTTAPSRTDSEGNIIYRNEICYLGFNGSSNETTSTDVPTGYTAFTNVVTKPWLRVDYSSGTPSSTPSAVNVIDADCKKRIACAGTASGNLWKISYDGIEWRSDFIKNYGDAITAVYMSKLYNFQDWPNTQLTYVGTSAGNVWVNFNSLEGGWENIASFDSEIKDIFGSNLWSGHVAVATANYIYYTTDNFVSYYKRYSQIYEYVDMWVFGHCVQVLRKNGSTGYMSYSLDWGATHSIGTSVPDDPISIAFDVRNYKKSYICTASNIYVSDDSYDYTVTSASPIGDITCVETDLYSNIAYIGTTSKVYWTNDYGVTLVEVNTGNSVVDLAVSGSILST